MKKTPSKQGRGYRVGYIRVSSVDQNTARQLDGVELDKAFTDKASGKNTDRPQLKEAMDFLREGDTLVCHSMDRLARNLDDLRKIVSDLTARGVGVHFAKEGMTFTGEDSPMSKFMLSVMGAFAEMERSVIRERQREGIAIAKAKGIYKGRKPKLTDVRVEEVKQRVAAGETKAEIARVFGVSRQTLYSYL
jgi:DNA invertase Pin-like site-specific DNA recombinase